MKVGDVVEEFSLEDQQGDMVSLTSLVAEGPVVMYFYIKAMTSG